MTTTSPIIVALDFPTLDQALTIADQLDPNSCRLKVGKELFTRVGPTILAKLHERGFEVFLDLKFHDIPNTVAGAVSAAADHGVWMVNVHASGGPAMLAAAKQALGTGQDSPLLIGVTILTSIDQAQWQRAFPGMTIAQQIEHLTSLCAESGLDGIVCSAQEAAHLKSTVADRNPNFITVTPGIRTSETLSNDDQQRTMAPRHALQNGADYLVIGRPITQAADPLAALQAIQQSINLTQ